MCVSEMMKFVFLLLFSAKKAVRTIFQFLDHINSSNTEHLQIKFIM